MADIGNIKNFFVTWYDYSADPAYSVTQDITEDVLSVSFTDTGSGSVNECILKVSGAFGKYITDPNVPTVDVNGDGIGATAVALVSGGVVTEVNPTSFGSGYTSATATIVGGGGSGAMITPTVDNGQVVSYTVDMGGSGYNNPEIVFSQYDRFKVEADDLNDNHYERFFEFNPVVVPSETKTEGTLLELNLIGIEYHTQRVTFSGRFWFANAFDVARAIGESYNENTGVIPDNVQPVLAGHTIGYNQVSGFGNGFPKYTVNHYEYGLVEDSGYNRWQQILDKLGGSVSNGGVLDYFDCGFETPDVNTIQVALFSQGSRTDDINDDANLPLIIQSLNVNVGATDVGIAAATATQVAAWGAQTRGSLPTGHSKYVSGVDQFIFRPFWEANIPYQRDSLVKYEDNKHYQALNDVTSATPPPSDTTNWIQIDMGNEFGGKPNPPLDTIPGVQYSEWTDDKAREWVNCGSNPSEVDTSNGVTSVLVTARGSGYTTAPVSFVGGGGAGAAATAVIKDGEIDSINVTDRGSGYTSEPSVTIGGDGSGATAESIIGKFYFPDTDNGKLGASMFDINIAILDNRDEARFFRTWVDFRLKDSGNRVTQILVDNVGSGYDSLNPPTVTIDNTGTGGSGAAAEASVNEDGEVTIITVIDGGTAYNLAPAVTIDPPSVGTTATATAYISSTQSISVAANNWAYSGQENLFPIGTRVLVDGINSDLSGNDQNNIPYANNIAEWDGTEWIVKYRPSETGTDLKNMQVVVIDEGLIYQWDNEYPTAWEIVTGDLAVDCLHQYTAISEVASFDPKSITVDDINHPDVTQDGDTFENNINSSLEFSYEVADSHQDRLLAGSGTPIGDFFKKGAWAVFRIPFSPNNYGSGVSVGNIYGTEDPSVLNLNPSFLDTQNMTWTSRGTRGFNQDNSEDFGQLQELAATIKITDKSVLNTNIDGPNIVRIWMIDRYDNTVYYDVEIPFVETFYPIKVPLSSFKIYRGHKPRFFDLTVNNIAGLLFPQELELYNRFAFREIQIVGFQLQKFYDEFGRYAPDISGDGLDFDINNTTFSKILGEKLAITIDDFHFTKPLLAIARQGTNINLETQFKKRPHIITFKQLLNDAATELEKEQFQLRQYEIETAGEDMFNIIFGDAFFFENERLVELQDDTENPSLKRIKLIAKHIQYNFTAPGTGEGGLTRTITGVKRFQ